MKLTRRDFGRKIVTASAAVGFGAALTSACSKSKEKQAPETSTAKIPVAIQLYTLRDLMKNDFAGTIKKVAEIGYDAVEFAGYGGLSAAEIKKLLDDLGLLCAGTHTGFGSLDKDLEATIEFNQAIGNKNIVCPSMPGNFRKQGVDGIKTFAEKMNMFGEKITKAGMGLYYHNHSFEFKQVGGKTLYELLAEAADPNLVKFEVDVYWVKRGGMEPVELLKKYGSRCKMLHMKDMADDKKHSFAPIGTGVLDMKGIVKAGKQIGVEWYIVEQDRTKRPVLEAIEISLKNMRKLLQA